MASSFTASAAYIMSCALVGFVAGTFIAANSEGGFITKDELTEILSTTTTTTVQDCQEDEPCWACDEMGNLICGPTTTNGEP